MRPFQNNQKFASWNIEGLTPEKLVSLQQIMASRNIGVLCLQETHRTGSEYKVTHEGYLLILSGSSSQSKEHAGVGFLVAPRMRRHVVSFMQADARYASLKLRVVGGKVNLITAYAPHAGHPYAERQTFFNELGDFEHRLSRHGPNIIMGDMNSRIYRRLPGEEDIIGAYILESAEATIPEDANRHLLIELCTSAGMIVANTFFGVSRDRLVTCYNVGSRPMDEVSWRSHGQIDFVLVPKDWSDAVTSVQTDRTLALPTHHFFVGSVDFDLSRGSPAPTAPSPTRCTCIGQSFNSDVFLMLV